MTSRVAVAAIVLLLGLPALAQQPVYPSYPPPPPASGDNAPHTQAPDPQADQQYPDQQAPSGPAQSQEDQQTSPPQKPSPYPQESQGSDSQGNGQAAPPPAYPAPAYPPQSSPYPPSGNYLSWVPQGMEVLSRTATFHTDFTFDRSMLQLASGIWEGPGDPGLTSAINRLDGISVHSYHYAAPGMYDPRLLNVVRQQYSALGWQHLVTARSASTGGATDLWISFHHMQATGAVVLFESPTNLNLISFSGSLSPLDLLHLRGHFGIPRFSGDGFVPAPGPAARVAPPRSR